MSREVKPRAKPRRPGVSEEAIAALERRIAGGGEDLTGVALGRLDTQTSEPPDAQTLETPESEIHADDRRAPILPSLPPTQAAPARIDVAGPGIVERKGRLTSDGRRGARVLRRMTVYMPPDLAKRIELRSVEMGRDRSELISEAVAAFLADA